jgi:hypothetical protein
VDTPMLPFDIGVFIEALRQAQSLYYTHVFYFRFHLNGPASSTACELHYRFLSSVYGLPGFTDVPDAWYGLYYEYRHLLEPAPSLANAYGSVCSSSDDAHHAHTQAIVDYVDATEKRLSQMMGEASAIP